MWCFSWLDCYTQLKHHIGEAGCPLGKCIWWFVGEANHLQWTASHSIALNFNTAWICDLIFDFYCSTRNCHNNNVVWLQYSAAMYLNVKCQLILCLSLLNDTLSLSNWAPSNPSGFTVTHVLASEMVQVWLYVVLTAAYLAFIQFLSFNKLILTEQGRRQLLRSGGGGA